jgi:hypothetical protein
MCSHGSSVELAGGVGFTIPQKTSSVSWISLNLASRIWTQYKRLEGELQYLVKRQTRYSEDDLPTLFPSPATNISHPRR